MFRPSSLLLLPSQFLVVSDKLAAPGDFLLLSILASNVKTEGSRCVFVSVTENLSHWTAIAARLLSILVQRSKNPAVNLSRHTASGSLAFIDTLSDPSLLCPEQHSASSTLSLKNLYDQIRSTFSEGNDAKFQSTLIIVENISSFEWMGMSLTEIKRFVRALRSLCVKHNAALVIRHHIVVSDGIDELMQSLLQQCTYHLEVLPLSSGRSGAVSGEIAFHTGPDFHEPHSIPTIRRSKATQYHLTDSGAVFFERGTGAGVL